MPKLATLSARTRLDLILTLVVGGLVLGAVLMDLYVPSWHLIHLTEPSWLKGAKWPL